MYLTIIVSTRQADPAIPLCQTSNTRTEAIDKGIKYLLDRFEDWESVDEARGELDRLSVYHVRKAFSIFVGHCETPAESVTPENEIKR